MIFAFANIVRFSRSLESFISTRTLPTMIRWLAFHEAQLGSAGDPRQNRVCRERSVTQALASPRSTASHSRRNSREVPTLTPHRPRLRIARAPRARPPPPPLVSAAAHPRERGRGIVAASSRAHAQVRGWGRGGGRGSTPRMGCSFQT